MLFWPPAHANSRLRAAAKHTYRQARAILLLLPMILSQAFLAMGGVMTAIERDYGHRLMSPMPREAARKREFARAHGRGHGRDDEIAFRACRRKERRPRRHDVIILPRHDRSGDDTSRPESIYRAILSSHCHSRHSSP